MNSDLHIRLFTYRDAQLFSRLRKDIEKESDYVLAEKNERTETGLHVLIRLLISQRRIVTFLAFDNKTPVGYVSLVFPKFTKLQGNAYLTIGVRESYRGKGIGTELMNKAEEYAKGRGIRRMELEVFSKNPALKLYTRKKYEVEGVKKDAVKYNGSYDDIIIMAKRFNEQ